MKRTELEQAIEEIIIEILSPEEQRAKSSAKAAAQEDAKDATNDLRIATTSLEKKAAQDELNLAKKNLAKANAMTEAEDEDDDSPAEKEPSKAELKKLEKELGSKNKKKDEIISAYKKIAGDIKEKAKAANSGDKEAKAWIDKYQSIIKAYKKLQKVG